MTSDILRTSQRVQVQDEWRIGLALARGAADVADDSQAPVQVVVDGHEHEAEAEQVHRLQGQHAAFQCSVHVQHHELRGKVVVSRESCISVPVDT